MQTNGRRSCTGNSRHIHIRHFFVKDLIDKKKIRVLYCPTTKMLADFFTKPLQGELFRFFRNIIMGYVSVTDLFNEDGKIKERVGKWEKYKNGLISNIEKNEDTDNKKVKKVKINTYVQEVDGSSNGSSDGSPDGSSIQEPNDSVRTHENTVEPGSTYTNKSKPTYANIARRANKYEHKAHKLN